MELPPFFDNFARLAEAPNGVQKLRELILSLAVRGKLVPQDPSDEPASVLLERIKAEKGRLVKEKKIRKSEPLPPVGVDEAPYELPPGWEWSRIGDVVLAITGGGTPSKQNPRYWGGGIPWASVKDLGKGKYLESTIDHITQLGLSESSSNLIPEGQVIVCTRMGLGKIAINRIPTAINQDLKALSLFGNLYIDYFYNYYLTQNIQGSGMTVSGIKQDALLSMLFPLTPIAEQQRIVAKVDQLMALCDELEERQQRSRAKLTRLNNAAIDRLLSAREAETFAAAWGLVRDNFDLLYTTPETITKLRQAILKLAVQGKLVPQGQNDEPASVLLARIQAEKERLVKAGKIKKDKPLSEISEQEKPFAIPRDWEWVRMQSVFDVRDGTHDTPKYVDGDGVPLITSRNFIGGEIYFYDAKLISWNDHEAIKKRSAVDRGDILYSMIGGNIGNQVLVDTDREFSIKNVALFKYYNRKETLPEYLNLFLKTVTIGLQKKAIGGAQPFVSLALLRNIPFALPPLAEQHRIVAKVDQLMALCDELEAKLTKSQTKAEKLAAAAVKRLLARNVKGRYVSDLC